MRITLADDHIKIMESGGSISTKRIPAFCLDSRIKNYPLDWHIGKYPNYKNNADTSARTGPES